MVKAKGYKIIGYYFRSSIGESIERNSRRQGKANVPQKAILCTSKKLELEHPFDVRFRDMMIKAAKYVMQCGVFT